MSASAAWPSWLDEPLSRGLSMRAHAMLVHAPGALGQFELALALARAFLCETPQRAGLACGGCAACRLMGGHSHPDFHLLLPETLREPLGWPSGEGEGDEDGEGRSKSKASREIKIKALRAAIDWSQRTPSRGRAKVFVIHPAEAMNTITANALLKTLEEPPGRLRLLLTTTDPETLLPTLRSRCQRLPIAVPSASVASAWLAGQGVADADVLLAAAGGQPQGALGLQEQGISGAQWQSVPGVVRRGHAAAVTAWSLPCVIDALQKLCLDLMALHLGASARFFSASALAPALRPAIPPLSRLVAWQQELLRAARHDEHAWHAALRVEALVVQGSALWQTARAQPPGRTRALDTLPGK
jgi:DNA polymerase-3 subunit delta'